jgi:hypothetical protein
MRMLPLRTGESAISEIFGAVQPGLSEKLDP